MATKDAARLHREMIVIDGTCPQMNEPEHWSDWIRGGATVAIVTVASSEDSKSTFAKLARWHRWLRENNDRLQLVAASSDVQAAKGAGRLGVMFHFQDTLPLDGEIDLLSAYQALGVRMIQLCYNQRNLAGDGCSERTDIGLSDFGVAAIKEMNRLGVIVDLSHTGYRTTMEAIEVTGSPPVFSHSNVRALCDNRRNIRDDQIKAVAAKGGLVGMNGFPAFVRRDRRPTLSDLLDHVDHVARLVGVDHIGLGLDYYGLGSDSQYAEAIRLGRWKEEDYPPPPHHYPEGIEDASMLPNVTAGLIERGYAEADVAKIMGLNWMRVIREVCGA